MEEAKRAITKCNFLNIAHWDIFVMEILLQLWLLFLKSDFIHHVAYIPLSPNFFYEFLQKGKKKFVYVNLNS